MKLISLKNTFHSNSFKNTLALILALFSSAAGTIYLELKTSNIFSFVLFFAYLVLIRKSFNCTDKKISIVSLVTGCLLAVFMALGKAVAIFDQCDAFASISYLLFFFIGFGIIFSAICNLLFSYARNITLTDENKSPATRKQCAVVFFISVFVILLAWIPYFLSEYPANLTPDSNSQLLQALSKEELSNHHPIIHTLFIRFVVKIGLSVFNNNITDAVALYSVIQAILLAICFSFLAETMYKFRYKNWAIALVVAYFALMPYHALYSITLWKDVLFGGIVLALTVTLWRIIKWYKDKTSGHPISDLILFFVLGLGMCLFRSNGLYAYLLLFALLVVFYWKKSIPLILSAVLVIGCSFVIKGPVFNKFQVTAPDTIESLSLPAQHISRAICNGYELTTQEYDLLSNVVDVEKIPQTYAPHISDPIKNLIREKNNQQFIEKNKLEFAKLWLTIGLKNPTSYLSAQIDQTIGYWYPDVQYWVHATYIEYNDKLACSKASITSPEFVKTLRGFANVYLHIPFFGLLWSIGAFTWLTIVLLGFSIIKDKKELLLIFVPVIAILLTLMIATPVHAEFRYAYSLFTTVPLLLVAPFCNQNIKEHLP